MRTLRITFAFAGLLAALTACASAPVDQAASSCYWPGSTSHDCREFIEFNSWR